MARLGRGRPHSSFVSRNLLSTPVVYPRGVDQFDRVSPSGIWGLADEGGEWSVNVYGGAPSGQIAVSGVHGDLSGVSVGQASSALLTQVSRRDLEVYTEVEFADVDSGGISTMAVIAARVQSGWSNSYFLLIWKDEAHGDFLLYQVGRGDPSTNSIVAINAQQSFTPGGYMFRARFAVWGVGPTHLQAKIWEPGSAEPGSWNVDITDSTGPQVAGAFGLANSGWDPDVFAIQFGSTEWQTVAADQVSMVDDAISHSAGGQNSTADSISAEIGTGTINRAVTDTGVTISDSVARVAAHPRTATDTATTASDSIARASLKTRTTSDTAVTPSDSIARTASHPRAVTDTACTMSDSVARTASHPRALTDTAATITDSVARTMARMLSDTAVAPALSAFPATGLLDDYNRGSLGSGWTANGTNFGLPAAGITGNQLNFPSGGGGDSYWNASTYGPDTEVWADVPALPVVTGSVLLYGRLVSPASAGADAYLLELERTGTSTFNLNLYRHINGTPTLIDSEIGGSFNAGDSLGLRITGSGATVHIEAYVKFGGTWTLVFSFDDTDANRITSAGYIGVATPNTDSSVRLDNFAGGTFVTALSDTVASNRRRVLTDTACTISDSIAKRQTVALSDAGVAPAGVVAVTALDSVASTVDGTSFVSNSFAPAANALVVVGVLSIDVAGGNALEPTLDSPDWLAGAWTKVTSVGVGTNQAITVFRGVASGSPTADTVAASFGATMQGSIIIAAQVTGQSVGSPVPQSKTGFNNTSGTSATITLDNALADATSEILAFLSLDNNVGSAPNGGESELADLGHGSPAQAFQAEHKLNAATASWTFTSSRYRAVALELAAGALSDSIVAQKNGGLTNRNITDTGATISDSVASTRVRAISDTAATASDSVARVAVHPRTATDTGATVTDALTTRRSRSFADTAATVSDSIVRTAVHPRAATDTAVTVTDSLALLVRRVLTDTGASIVDTASGAIQRSIIDTGLTLTETLRVRPNRMLSDTATSPGDSITKTKILSRSITDTGATVTDAISKRASRTMVDTGAGVSDALASRRVRVVTDTAATFSDSIARVNVTARSITDTGATFSDTLASARSRSASDTATTAGDSLARVATHPRSASDTGATISDAVARALFRSCSDTAVTPSDSIARAAVHPRSVSDTAATVTDSLASNRVRRLSDTATTAGDSLVRAATHARSITDTGATVAEALVSLRSRALSDTACAITDSLAPKVARAISDTAVTPGDSITKTKRYVRSLTDTGATVADAVTLLVRRLISDTGATIVDTSSPAQFRSVTDTGATVTDSLVVLRGRPITDTGASVTDAIRVRPARTVSDVGVDLEDSVSTSSAGNVSITDTGATITEQISASVSRSISDVGATVSDSLASQRSRSFADVAVVQSDSIASRPVRAVSDTAATITDALALTVAHDLSDAGATLTDTVIPTQVRVLTDIAVTAITDAISATVGRTLTDTGAAVTDDLTPTQVRALEDTAVTAGDAIAVARAFNRALVDAAATVSDSLSSSQAGETNISDTAVTLTDTLSAATSRRLTDTGAVVSDVLVLVAVRSAIDTATTISDEVALEITRELQDTGATVIDTPMEAIFRSVTDTGASVSDSIESTGTHTRSVVDTGTAITDSLAPTIRRSLADTAVTVTDATSLRVSRALQDTGANVSDIVLAASGQSVADIAVTLTDSVDRTATHPRTANDQAATIADAISIRAYAQISDTACSIAGDTVRVRPTRKLVDTGAAFADSIQRSLVAFRQVSDTGTVVVDTISGTVFRLPADVAVSMSDTLQGIRVGRFMVDVGSTVTDSLSFQHGNVFRNVSDIALTMSDFIEGGSRPTIFPPVGIVVRDSLTGTVVRDPATLAHVRRELESVT